MPDYTLKLWDANSFDFNSIAFVKEAFEAKKWAFVADYIRLYALYTEGGIYLDSDVKVFRQFDEFLSYNFFTSHEYHPANFSQLEVSKLDVNYRPININETINGMNVQAAIMGAKKGNLYLKDCLNFYDDKHLIDENNNLKCEDFIIGPIISKIAERYGYTYQDTEQLLDQNMIIFKTDKFVGNSSFYTKNAYAIHLCNGTWREKNSFDKMFQKIRNHYPSFFPLYFFLYKIIKKIGRLFYFEKN